MTRKLSFLTVLCLIFGSLAAEASDPRSRAASRLALTSSVALFDTGKVQSGEAFCSGVVIGVKQVLTASHCLRREHLVDRITFVTYDGKEHRGIRIAKERRGWDLAIAEVDTPLGGRIPALTIDIAPGDPLFAVGSVDGEEFTIAYLRLSKVIPEVAFGVCEPDKFDGNEPHQMLTATGTVWSGSSGGGVFDDEGSLVGIITNMRVTGEFECVREEGKPPRSVVLWAGGPLWAWVIGPETMKTFLAGTIP